NRYITPVVLNTIFLLQGLRLRFFKDSVFITVCHTLQISIFIKYPRDLEFFYIRKVYLSHNIRHLKFITREIIFDHLDIMCLSFNHVFYFYWLKITLVLNTTGVI